MVERVCGNCASCTFSGVLGRTICGRTNRGVSDNQKACQDFVSDEENTCIDYIHQGWKDGAFGFGGYPICERNGKKLSSGQRACSNFVKG